VLALAVRVREVLADDVGEVALVSDQDPVEAFATGRADEPLGKAFATGVRIVRIPSLAKTVSKASVNFESRSRVSTENRSS
jgi:hypothetical protein